MQYLRDVCWASAICQGRLDQHAHKGLVAQDRRRCRMLRRQPTSPSMTRMIESKRAFNTRNLSIMTSLDTLKVLLHRITTPRRVFGERGNLIPFAGLRSHQDHGVVSRATAQRARAWIEDAALLGPVFRVAPLLLLIAIMTD